MALKKKENKWNDPFFRNRVVDAMKSKKEKNGWDPFVKQRKQKTVGAFGGAK